MPFFYRLEFQLLQGSGSCTSYTDTDTCSCCSSLVKKFNSCPNIYLQEDYLESISTKFNKSSRV